MKWIFHAEGLATHAEEYLICDEADKTSMTGYRVFDGIELVYNDIEKDTCGIERSARGRFSPKSITAATALSSIRGGWRVLLSDAGGSVREPAAAA